MISQQQLLYSLYVFCKTGEECGARIRALLDSHESKPIEGYEPFAGDSPCAPPIGGDF